MLTEGTTYGGLISLRECLKNLKTGGMSMTNASKKREEKGERNTFQG
jgi:hypothetical protein